MYIEIPLDFNNRTCMFRIILQGRRSVSRAGCQGNSILVSFEIGPSAGLWLAEGLILKLTQWESGRKPNRKPGIYSGRPHNHK